MARKQAPVAARLECWGDYIIVGHISGNTRGCLKDRAGLTQTVVSIVGQHEAIVAGTPVVSRDVDAFVDTSSIVVVLTFIHV